MPTPPRAPPARDPLYSRLDCRCTPLMVIPDEPPTTCTTGNLSSRSYQEWQDETRHELLFFCEFAAVIVHVEVLSWFAFYPSPIPDQTGHSVGKTFTEHKTAIHTCSQCSHRRNHSTDATGIHSGPSPHPSAPLRSRWLPPDRCCCC